MDVGRLAVDADLAAIGAVIAVEDVHQGRLAGAVLADDAVDRALGDAERHIPVGMNRTEPLVDADGLDRPSPPLRGDDGAIESRGRRHFAVTSVTLIFPE